MIHDAQSGTGPTEATGAHLQAGPRSFPGDLRAFAGPASTVPNGWLLAAGQAISRTTYANLFAALGTSYGTGNGTTTFNLPDLRGRIPVGLDNMGGSDAGRLSVSNTLGGTGGAETHTLTEAQIPTLAHSISQTPHVHGLEQYQFVDNETPAPAVEGIYNNSLDYPAGGSATVTNSANASISIANHGGGQAHNNLQPYQLTNWIIRT